MADKNEKKIKTLGYKIDWATNTVKMTKAFAAAANEFNSPEYRQLMEMRAAGFNIHENESVPRKACPTRISFKKMETILSCMDYADERLEQLHAVMAAGKGTNNQYEYVRKWFLRNYPHFNDLPVLDTNCRIVAPRVVLLPEDVNQPKLCA